MKTIRTVGCFLEYDDKFVILHRHSSKSQGDTWGLPAGKVEPDESDETAILRELWEETGYQAAAEQLESLGVHEFHFPDVTVVLPTFRVRLQEPFKVVHRPHEHQASRWVTADECYAMPNLIHGFHDLLVRIGCIKLPTA